MQIKSFNVSSREKIVLKQEISGSGGVFIGAVVSQCQRATLFVLFNALIQHFLEI